MLVTPLTLATTLEGKMVQGGMLVGHTEAGSQVLVDGERIRVSPDGYFLIGFSRDQERPVKLKIIKANGVTEQRLLAPAKREYQIQRIDGLPSRKVTPRSEEDLRRIRADVSATKKARALDAPRTDFLSGWQWPATGPISGVYGSQRILNGKPRRPHFGVDIARPTGTPVLAPADGVVTLAHTDMFFSGGTLILDHGHQLSSSFLHLSKILVKEGDVIKKGEVIAEIGATGRVTGAHLDWRMNLGDARIDPALLVPPMEEVLAGGGR
jgi:murein DD-endopeptidase MepM/ murein hydrolase activator NlpD